jgi:hypothetical protein
VILALSATLQPTLSPQSARLTDAVFGRIDAGPADSRNVPTLLQNSGAPAHER